MPSPLASQFGSSNPRAPNTWLAFKAESSLSVLLPSSLLFKSSRNALANAESENLWMFASLYNLNHYSLSLIAEATWALASGV